MMGVIRRKSAEYSAGSGPPRAKAPNIKSNCQKSAEGHEERVVRDVEVPEERPACQGTQRRTDDDALPRLTVAQKPSSVLTYVAKVNRMSFWKKFGEGCCGVGHVGRNYPQQELPVHAAASAAVIFSLSLFAGRWSTRTLATSTLRMGAILDASYGLDVQNVVVTGLDIKDGLYL